MKALVFAKTAQKDAPPAPDFLPGLASLQLCDVPTPDLPNERWVVVKSKISGICGSDLGFLQWKPMPAAEPYFELPLIPGHELFGEVAAVGKHVRGLRVGQRVTVDPDARLSGTGLSETVSHSAETGTPGFANILLRDSFVPGC